MKKAAIIITSLLLTKFAFGAPEYKCGKKYTAVSCSEVKKAKRSHLCLKYPNKLTEAKKDRWCKLASKKSKKVSMK